MRIDEYIVPENVIPIIRNKQVLEGMPENTPFVKKRSGCVVSYRNTVSYRRSNKFNTGNRRNNGILGNECTGHL